MRDRWIRLLTVFGMLGFAALWIWNPTFSYDASAQLLIKSVVLHGVGILIFIPLTVRMGYHAFRLPNAKGMLVCLPALLVAINNFPILGVVWGNIRIVRPDLIPWYLLNCLLIGAFEELAFRGTLFLLMLEKRRETSEAIFKATLFSSLLFGLFHLSNLLEGAGVGPTLLQVGYSILIGGMCAITLLKTQNLILPILLHGIYDLGGTLLSSGVGDGRMWDTPTVVITAVLGVATFAWMLRLLAKMQPRDVDGLF